MRRVALLSVHTSPLALPGQGEAGGMNVYVRELSTQLGQNGLAVDVFTRRTDPEQPIVTEIDDRVRLVALKAGPLEAVSKSRLFPFLPELVCNLVRFKEQHRLTYDALHTHYWLSGWVGSLLHQHWNIPLIATFHTLAELKRQARPEEYESDQRLTVERRLVAAADALVATSPHERSQLVDLYGANPSKVFVIPCGVDLDRFRPLDRRAAKAELGLHGHRTLLVVGRLEPLKGIDLVIRALALLNRPRLRLVIVGDDSSHAPEAERLRQLAAELGVSRQVRFVGAVEQSRLPVYYAAADLCLVPSHYESFGLTALEALACGTPVIASKVGGLTSVVNDGRNGFLLPFRCPESYAERIERVLDDARLWRRLSRQARVSAQRYSWGRVASAVLDLYQELAAARATASLSGAR